MRKKYDKQDIIAQGAALIRRKGFHSTGINDILKEVGIPKGSFYNFFASKEEFGQLILEHYGDGQVAFINSVFKEQKGSPLQKLKHFYDVLHGYNIEEDYRYTCLVNNMSMETAGHNQNLAKTSAIQFEKWLKLLAEQVEEGQKLGEIRDDIPAIELADFMHTNLYGAFSRSKMLRNGEVALRNMDFAFRFMEGK